jgi:hypothetical protein
MSFRVVARLLGKFAFRAECPGRADRRIGGRLRQFGWVRKLTRSVVAGAPTAAKKRLELSPTYCSSEARDLHAACANATLKEAGAIDGYVALPDPVNVGIGRLIFARVWLTGQNHDTGHRRFRN